MSERTTGTGTFTAEGTAAPSETAASLNVFFKPCSVAVIGASRRAGAIGNHLFRNLLREDFAGVVHPVNANAESVASVKAYHSVLDVPGEVDLAVIVVPAGAVAEILDECGRKGTRGAIIISAGFGESGEEGQKKQDELIDIARRYRMRVIGPNCMGVINTGADTRLNATFSTVFPPANGIQAMDLLGRKLGMKKGAVFIDFLNEIRVAIVSAREIPRLEEPASQVEKALNRLSEIAMHISKTAFSKDKKLAFAYAHPFLEVVGDVIMAWMLLWRAAVAVPRLEKLAGSADEEAIQSKVAKNKDAAFYDGQLKAAEFFISSMLPVTMGKMNAIAAPHPAAIDIHEKSFGG